MIAQFWTRLAEERRSPAKNAQVVYVKYWTHTNWLQLEKIPIKERAPHLLDQTLVAKYWCEDEMQREHITTLAFLNQPSVDQLWKSDKLPLESDYYDGVIVPFARAKGIVHA